MPHVLLKCDDPGSRRAAASTRFDVLLFRALMGEDSAAVSRCALTQFMTVYLRQQVGFLFYVRAAACLWCSCLCPDVRGRVAPGRETVTHFVLFKRRESRTRRRKLVNRKKVTELRTACRLVYLKMTSKAALTCLVLSVKGRRGAGCHFVSASMLDANRRRRRRRRWCRWRLKWMICLRCRVT